MIKMIYVCCFLNPGAKLQHFSPIPLFIFVVCLFIFSFKTILSGQIDRDCIPHGYCMVWK